MTAMMRQSCKQILTIAVLAAVSCGALAGAATAPARAAIGPAASIYVTDPLTGVALGGMDAVSYSIGAAPEPGRPDFAYIWQGVTWYFANAANRDVFIRAPEVYAPAFGGHGVMGLSRGFLSDGNPQIYLIVQGQLLLFYSTSNRDAFEMSADEALSSAARNWPRLKTTLVGSGTGQPSLMAW